MGIRVPVCTLPNGIDLNNVYLTFKDETLTITKDPSGNAYAIITNYRVYKDSSCTGPDVIKCRLLVEGVPKTMNNPFSYLYDSLKKTYPGSVDENSDT
jgi:hypothetical protein